MEVTANSAWFRKKKFFLFPPCIFLNWLSLPCNEGEPELAQGKWQESTGKGKWNRRMYKSAMVLFWSAWFYSGFVCFELDEFLRWWKAWSRWPCCWHCGRGVLWFLPGSSNVFPQFHCQTGLISPGCILLPCLNWTQVCKKSHLHAETSPCCISISCMLEL